MATYYVVSTATGAADGSSEADAFTTIDAAMNQITSAGAGPHKVWVKATATYDENANIDTAGTATAYVTFEGYSSTTGDNGKVTWTNSSGSALTDTPSGNFYCFKNFSIDGCSSTGAAVASNFVFMNCDFINNGGAGMTGSGTISFINCEFNSNTSYGADSNGNSVYHIGSIAHSNGSHGLRGANASNGYYKCLLYNNSNNGIDCTADFSFAIGNTIDNENDGTYACIDMGNEFFGPVVDNILYDSKDAILCTDTNSVTYNNPWCYNLINSCTNSYYTGATEFAGDWKGYNDVTTAPAFTDEAGDDYTLATGSAAIDSGVSPGGIT
jgi:hypothetical protein